MAKSRDPYFYRTDLDLSGDDPNPDIEPGPVTVTIGKNFLWDLTARVWRKATGDYNGRTRVTSGPGNNTNIFPRMVTVFNTETLVADNNPARQGILIDNQASCAGILAFRAGDIAAGFYYIFPNDFIAEIDGYTGQIYMQSSASASIPFVVTEY